MQKCPNLCAVAGRCFDGQRRRLSPQNGAHSDGPSCFDVVQARTFEWLLLLLLLAFLVACLIKDFRTRLKAEVRICHSNKEVLHEPGTEKSMLNFRDRQPNPEFKLLLILEVSLLNFDYTRKHQFLTS
uniref:Uncharacterized protein n=1 Tax=Globodera rostochiensis TaxID=31243 RepID=A0A914I4D5_GLORO